LNCYVLVGAHKKLQHKSVMKDLCCSLDLLKKRLLQWIIVTTWSTMTT